MRLVKDQNIFQNEYNKRHDKVAENGQVRYTWNIPIYTVKRLQYNRSDIVLLLMEFKEWACIDVAISAH